MTDKYANGLDKVYGKYLLQYVGKAISLLEIGVAEGQSLMMFEGILPDAQVYGFDINIPGLNRNTRAIIETIDQTDSKAIEDFAVRHGGFDVIIDDGSHFTYETKNCFDILWKYTREFYVIEDWGICIADDLMYHTKYKDRVLGMGELVLDIAMRRKELDIGYVEIVLNNKHSYALYKTKGEHY